MLTCTPKAVYFNFLSSFLLSQTIDCNRTFLGSIHSGCRFLTEIIQYLIGMIAGDTEFANYILHRDISLLLANLHNVGKLLIRLLRSKFHIPILAAATVRTTFQSFQEFLRGLNFQTAYRCEQCSPYSCKQYSRKRESGGNARKMGKKEMENFPLRVFIFFLKGKYIFP